VTARRDPSGLFLRLVFFPLRGQRWLQTGFPILRPGQQARPRLSQDSLHHGPQRYNRAI